MIEVSEIYAAPQGEGPNLGRPSIFLRVHRCPLHCSWCDTKFTWDKTDPGYDDFDSFESPVWLAGRLVQAAQEQKVWPRGLVVTGGEPMLYQRDLPEVISLYRSAAPYDIGVEIETAGTITPVVDLQIRVHFNVSPKLSSSGNTDIGIENLWSQEATRVFLRCDSIFKLVVGKGDEASLYLYLDWLKVVGEEGGWSWKNLAPRVYLMPCGVTQEELAITQPLVLELAQDLGVNATTRMQIVAYGNERKR